MVPSVYKLPSHSSEWNLPCSIPWSRITDPREVELPKILTMPFKFKKTPSPVTKANRDEFTETQRTCASEAPVATSIEDLEDGTYTGLLLIWPKISNVYQINAHCAGGEVKPNKYIEINSSILKRYVLLLSLVLIPFVPDRWGQRLLTLQT
jgi:hypothetical protein